MSGVHDSVSVSRQHTHSANRATVIVGDYHSSSKSLIARSRSQCLPDRESFCIFLLSGLFKQILAVLICFKVDDPLFHQSRMQFRREVLFDKECAKLL